MGGVEKCEERCGGENSIWNECGSTSECEGRWGEIWVEVWGMWGSVLGKGRGEGRCGERCREVLGKV